jgi:hypothetical protein
MATEELLLPKDIPWKRLCVSEDMIDKEVCDSDFPPRWRSSLAIFNYEPPEGEQPDKNYIVSYFKIACTITGHNIGTEMNIKNPLSQISDVSIWDAIAGFNRYDPCYGAILDVSAAPIGDYTIVEYPLFIDFSPKKRELYELYSCRNG